MEHVLNPEQLDEWFENVAENQYTRKLFFSSVFDIMSQVVSSSRSSVHSAYQASVEDIGVSITSVYNKLNGVETKTSAELVRYCAKTVTPVIKGLNGVHPHPLPGYTTKLLDGNCIAASDHRIDELRRTGSMQRVCAGSETAIANGDISVTNCTYDPNLDTMGSIVTIRKL